MFNLSMHNGQPFFQQLFSLKDPRTKNWITLKEPSFIAVTIFGYLYMAKIWGPKFMKHRKPFELSRVIQLYNVFQVLANVFFCLRIAYLAYGKLGYSPYCQGLSYSKDEDSLKLLDSLYYYLMVRVADFADTLFFILKKKFTHITQLHVIHHTIVVFSGWQFMQFGGDGQSIFGVCLNSMVHIMMYSYYFLATLGPEVQKYLWWKKYLTTLQIVQFFAMIAHASIPLFVDCGYPRILLSLALPQIILILVLFINFYVQSYIKKHRKLSDNPLEVGPGTSKKLQ